MHQSSYAILGTGALGGYYGGLLARVGIETHFLLRSDYEHVKENGLGVDSIHGDFTIPADQIHAYDDPAAMPACDVAVVCLKTTQNDQLPELLARCVKPGGVVLVLQNGLQPEADAAAVVGDDRVLGGLCFLCSNKIGPGHIQHLDYGHIHLGVYQPGTENSPAATYFRGIVDDFNHAGIDTTGVDDLRLSRWKKLVWNIPYNGLSVVLNQTTDVMMADPPTRQRIKRIMHEVQAAALAVDGKVIENEFIETMLDYTAKMEPYKTSMMLDFEEGRAMEIEAIVGDPLRAAYKSQAKTDKIAQIYAQLTNIAYGQYRSSALSDINQIEVLLYAAARNREDYHSDTTTWLNQSCNLIRAKAANGSLVRNDWYGIWRHTADTISPPNSPTMIDFYALQDGVLAKIAKSMPGWE